MTQGTEKQAVLNQSQLDSVAGGYDLMEEAIRDMKEHARLDNEAVAAEEAAAEAAANAPPAAPKPSYGRYSGGRIP